MDYVCRVIGELCIDENKFKLKMLFNEIVDLSQDDFKVSPRLRAALRSQEIEIYTPSLHKKAKRLKSRKKMVLIQENIIPLKQKKEVSHNNSDITEIKTILGNISNRMNTIVSRLDLIVLKVVESNKKLNANFDKFFSEKQSIQDNYPKLDSLLNIVINTQNKFNTYLKDQKKIQIPEINPLKEEKLDRLLGSMEKLLLHIEINGKNSNIKNSNVMKDSIIDDDYPLFIPKIETDVSHKHIITKEISSDGTDGILAKLKNLKV